MIFTVGRTARYDLSRESWKQPGGWVFKTATDANTFLIWRNSVGIRSVYGVDADWEADTIEVPGQPYRELTRAARIIKLG